MIWRTRLTSSVVTVEEIVHTKEVCFKLIGFPEWWEEHRQRKAATKAPSTRTGGKANIATCVLHTESMSIGGPTHKSKAREDNNGDTGEPEKRNGNGPEERKREREK